MLANKTSKSPGVVIEPTHQENKESFVPAEAVEASEKLRNEPQKTPPRRFRKSDPFSEERIDKNEPAVDSSDETFGG